MPTLIVEDGTGLTGANTYLSLADADIYWVTNRGNPSPWSTADDDAKNVALLMGTAYLDFTYNGLWRGRRVARENSLDWPRWDFKDSDGFQIYSDEIPQAVKDAAAEAALRHLVENTAGTKLLPDYFPGSIKRERKYLPGPLGKDVTYAGGKRPYKKYPVIDRLLYQLIRASGRIERA